MQALTSGQWVTDPNFKNTTLLLQGDSGANGAQNNLFLDTSPNQFAITRNGNTTQGSFTPFSCAPTAWGAYNSGSSSYCQLNNSDYAFSTGDFTIEFWMFVTSDKSQVGLLSATTNSNLTIGYGSGSANARQPYVEWGGAGAYIGTMTGYMNTWVHIAFVRSSGTVTVYQNGISIGSASKSAAVGSTANLYLLRNSGDGGQDFPGYISNLRICKAAVYTSNFTPSTIPFTTSSQSATNCVLLTFQNNRFIDNSSTAATVTPTSTSVQPFSPFAPQFQYTASGTGGSGYFDGTGDYLLGGTSSAYTLGTGNYCIEFWMYATNTSSSTGIIGLGGAVTGVGTVFINAAGGSANVRMNAVNGTAITTANSVWSANSWNHIAITRQTNTVRIFVNGVLRAQGSFTDNLGGTDLSVGRSYYNLDQEYFTGWLSNVRIIKGSVPTSYQTSSTTIGDSIFTPPTSPLTTSSQGATAANVSILLNFTNAGILDGTMKNNLETVGNASVSTSVVKYGSGSMYFDGTGDYLVVPSGQNTTYGTGDFTIESWVYCANTATGSIQIIYDQRSTGSQAVPTLYIDSNGNLQYYVSGANRITYSGVVPAGAWNHVAVSRANSNTRMFLNGVQVGSTYSDTTTYISNPVGVGAYLGSPSLYLNGYIDDLRITKGFARYTANFTPPSVALPRQ
jgi:hypothetical protein